MRVPRLSSPTQYLCGMEFSLLGYGDIIVPGGVAIVCECCIVSNLGEILLVSIGLYC